MYYKGTTMDEIQKYLTEELQSAKEEKENLEEQIHKIEIETELICQAIDKIVMNQDATSLVFMSEEEFQGFDGTEDKKAESEKDSSCRRKATASADCFPDSTPDCKAGAAAETKHWKVERRFDRG